MTPQAEKGSEAQGTESLKGIEGQERRFQDALIVGQLATPAEVPVPPAPERPRDPDSPTTSDHELARQYGAETDGGM